GEVFKKHFETGGTFLDFDPKRLKKMYNEKFEKGKKVAEQIKRENERKREAAEQATDARTSGNTVDKLKELAELKRDGLITEEEFAAMKKKLIGE
ncbi:MAG: SHOCT domain-containing protein, partial [Saprospiraceae bacterium]|nr:SHOCT domain-containing protein [Saprospiraceae bacterium]